MIDDLLFKLQSSQLNIEYNYSTFTTSLPRIKKKIFVIITKQSK